MVVLSADIKDGPLAGTSHLLVPGVRFYWAVELPEAIQAATGKYRLVANTGDLEWAEIRESPGIYALHTKYGTRNRRDDILTWRPIR